MRVIKKFVVYYRMELTEDWSIACTFTTEEDAIAYCDEFESVCYCYYEEVESCE